MCSFFLPGEKSRFSSFLALLLLNILYVRAFAGGLAISLSICARLLLFATLFVGVVVVVVVVVVLSRLFRRVRERVHIR